MDISSQIEVRDPDWKQSEKPSQLEILLQVKEVAELLGIHPNTVRIWADSGVLKSFRIGPRNDRRIPFSAVKTMLTPPARIV